MDNDMNDNKSFSVTVNCNPDEVFLDGEKNNDPIIKPPKDGIKTRPFIQEWRNETKVKTETRGRKPLNKTKDAVGPQRCKICDSTFTCSTTLGTHKFKVHHIGGEVCSQCQKVEDPQDRPGEKDQTGGIHGEYEVTRRTEFSKGKSKL